VADFPLREGKQRRPAEVFCDAALQPEIGRPSAKKIASALEIMHVSGKVRVMNTDLQSR
jgi:hypothetical protein